MPAGDAPWGRHDAGLGWRCAAASLGRKGSSSELVSLPQRLPECFSWRVVARGGACASLGAPPTTKNDIAVLGGEPNPRGSRGETHPFGARASLHSAACFPTKAHHATVAVRADSVRQRQCEMDDFVCVVVAAWKVMCGAGAVGPALTSVPVFVRAIAESAT